MREKLSGEVRKLRTALDEKTEALEIARSEMEAAVERARQRQMEEDKGMIEEEWRAARMTIDDDSRHCKELEERNAHLLEALSQALAEVDERAREMEVLRSAMKTAEEVKCLPESLETQPYALRYTHPKLYTLHSTLYTPYVIRSTLYTPYEYNPRLHTKPRKHSFLFLPGKWSTYTLLVPGDTRNSQH
jgi:hypothetical protein